MENETKPLEFSDLVPGKNCGRISSLAEDRWAIYGPFDDVRIPEWTTWMIYDASTKLMTFKRTTLTDLVVDLGYLKRKWEESQILDPSTREDVVIFGEVIGTCSGIFEHGGRGSFTGYGPEIPGMPEGTQNIEFDCPSGTLSFEDADGRVLHRWTCSLTRTKMVERISVKIHQEEIGTCSSIEDGEVYTIFKNPIFEGMPRSAIKATWWKGTAEMVFFDGYGTEIGTWKSKLVKGE